MKTIAIEELKDITTERKIKIENLQSQSNALIEIDGAGKATVSKENRERGAQLGKALSELRRLNEIDIVRLEKMKEISSKYNIDESEIHLLNLSIPALERQVSALETVIEQHKNLYGETYERQRVSKFSPFFQQETLLNKYRKELLNQTQARALMETLWRKK